MMDRTALRFVRSAKAGGFAAHSLSWIARNNVQRDLPCGQDPASPVLLAQINHGKIVQRFFRAHGQVPIT
jgi:hypothetical protein